MSLSITQKVYFAFGILAAVALTALVVIITTLASAKDDADILNALGRQRMLSQAMAKSTMGYVVGMDEMRLGHVSQGDDKPTLDEYNNTLQIFSETLAAMKSGGSYPLDLKMTKHKTISGLHDAQSQQLLAEIEEQLKQFKLSIGMMLNNEPGTKVFHQARIEVLTESNVLRKISNDLVSHYNTITNANQSRIFWVALAAGVLVIMIIVVLSYLIKATIIQPIKNTSLALHEISEGDGDLTRRLDIHSDDEMGELATQVNKIVDDFHNIIRQIMGTTASLVSSAENMGEISDQTSHGIHQQLSETEQVVDAMNQMTAKTQAVARSAEDAAEATKQTDSQALEGRRLVEQVSATIGDLAKEVQDAVGVINTLEQESENIGSVLDVIRGIAEQTNLLALNAAIEAARAGEQGRGFAVVADEVRTLASRTQQSTQEIQDMIERLQSGSKDAVRVMNSGHNRTEQSVEQVTQAGKAITEVVQSIENIREMNIQIAGAADEQSHVATQIDQSLITVKNISEQANQRVEQVEHASQGLSQLASELQSLVVKFKI